MTDEKCLVFILPFIYKTGLFDSQMCQIAGCKKEKKVYVYIHSNMLIDLF